MFLKSEVTLLKLFEAKNQKMAFLCKNQCFEKFVVKDGCLTSIKNISINRIEFVIDLYIFSILSIIGILKKN